jgi:DNA-binding IclR family transcriptional regulator
VSVTRKLVLTGSQAACLAALRAHKKHNTRIAIEAKLAVAKTATVLRSLARLGLARQAESQSWHATARGMKCRFETTPERRQRNNRLPGPGGQRLLDLLDRPMRASEIAERLGVSRQRVHQLLVKLLAQGCVRSGDPEKPLWLVMRADDDTALLSRDEGRVLSAIPRDYATDAIKIRLAARVPENRVHAILEQLLVRRFIEASSGFGGSRLYRVTDAGLRHPQCAQSARRAKARRLPVESERIREVLSIMFDLGELRIIDVTNRLNIPRQSMNALMQYLKRKHLVKKNGREYLAPYSLTSEGLAALTEMTRRQAA